MKPRRLVPSEQGSRPAPAPATGGAVETWARELFWQADAMSSRSVQRHIGPSEIGTPCDRQLAYKLQGASPLQPGGGSLAAIAGTGVHGWIANRIETLYDGTSRYLVETRGEYRGVKGTIDLFDRLTHRVVDWKTKEDAAAIRRIRREPDPWTPSWIVQTAIYGAAMEAAGEPVEEVAIVLVPRSGKIDDIFALVRPFDRGIADAAIDRMLALAETAPEDATVHTSGLCYSCPFYRNARLGIDLPTGCPGLSEPN